MRALFTLGACLTLAACGADTPQPRNDTASPGAAAPAALTLPSGAIDALTIVDAVLGSGAVAEPGAVAVVHYTGWLYDPTAENRRGSKFDSSVDRGQPFEFPLGAGRVIRGWDEGVAGMRVGGKRLLFIPSEYGYGERGAAGGAIPPNAALYFEVELLDVRGP
jgi:FKBP-type peptidyl-prolyl cis-trans isomerase FkpA